MTIGTYLIMDCKISKLPKHPGSCIQPNKWSIIYVKICTHFSRYNFKVLLEWTRVSICLKLTNNSSGLVEKKLDDDIFFVNITLPLTFCYFILYTSIFQILAPSVPNVTQQFNVNITDDAYVWWNLSIYYKIKMKWRSTGKCYHLVFKTRGLRDKVFEVGMGGEGIFLSIRIFWTG